jgi:uncharacterized protein (TIGR02722 family)
MGVVYRQFISQLSLIKEERMYRLLTAILAVMLLAGCAPEQTTDIDLDTDTAEDADYTSADLLAIADEMVESIKASRFDVQYAAAHGGQKPVMILARSLENNTDEHIDTRMILDKVRTQLIKDGIALFVDDQAFDQALDQLNMQATDLYDDAKAAQLGKFVGAHYIMRGSIGNIRKVEGRETRNYFLVTMTIVDIETLLITWIDEVEWKRKSTKGTTRW